MTLSHWQQCSKTTQQENRCFPEITGEDNLTVFSYPGRVKSPEWRWQQRRANMRHFEILRHGPIIIYTRLPAGGTYYPICICTIPTSSECLIGISDVFSAFCLWVSVIFPICSLYPQQKRAYSALHPQAWTYIWRSMPEGCYRVQSPGFLKIIYCVWVGMMASVSVFLSWVSWAPWSWMSDCLHASVRHDRIFVFTWFWMLNLCSHKQYTTQ